MQTFPMWKLFIEQGVIDKNTSLNNFTDGVSDGELVALPYRFVFTPIVYRTSKSQPPSLRHSPVVWPSTRMVQELDIVVVLFAVALLMAYIA